MSVLTVMLVIIAAGVLLFVVNSGRVPMDAKIKMIFNWVVVILLVVWLMKVFGLWAAISSARV